MNIQVKRKCETCNDRIVIDFNDPQGMTALMDKYPNCELFGQNEDGETTQTSVEPGKIVHITYQKNLCRRVNIMHRDGTFEELYDGTERESFRTLDQQDRALIRGYMDAKKVSLREAFERYLDSGRPGLESEVCL